MKKILAIAALCMLLPAVALANPRAMVTGVTAYDPEAAWNGFTVLSGNNSVKLVDMNGNLVHEWDLYGGQAFPPKVLPGGNVMAHIYPSYNQAGQGTNTVAILDFDSNILRSFNKLDQVHFPTPNMPVEADGTVWIARGHHDFQVEGSPTGYYAPSANPVIDGKLMFLSHATVDNPDVSPIMKLQDDRIIILDANNEIIFDWKASDHFFEFDNLATDENAYIRIQGAVAELGNPPDGLEYNGFDWFHINCVSWLGPNKWYDAGDQRFHPDNIIADSRETSHLFIIDHVTGEIVWQVAPPFVGEDAEIGPIYGVHSTHMIPAGLPGEGNILIFDNGGTTAYHKQLPPRFYSRVVEFNPVTKEVVWEYSHLTAGLMNWQLMGDKFFFSPFISNAQRLPNGNTLICEGSKNRIFEVTPDYRTVWEYINPYTDIGAPMVLTYRAYRVPYEYVPQLAAGSEVPVDLPVNATIQIPNREGVLPNVIPTLDTQARAVMAQPTPVMMPGVQNVPQAVEAQTLVDEEEAGDPGFKAY